MAKQTLDKRRRGPYKSGSNVKDPNKLGSGGIRLRQHRLARGWTIEDLATAAKVSEGLISGIEDGKVGFSADSLEALAKALKTTVGALFDVDPRPGHARGLWASWTRANDSGKARIEAFAEGVAGEQ